MTLKVYFGEKSLPKGAYGPPKPVKINTLIRAQVWTGDNDGSRVEATDAGLKVTPWDTYHEEWSEHMETTIPWDLIDRLRQDQAAARL